MARAYDLEADKCPHCGGITRLEEHAALRWVCAACDGPRVPADSDAVGHPRSGREAHALKKARAAWLAAAGARAASAALAALALVLGAGAAIALASHVAFAVTLLACAVVAGTFALGKRARASTQRRDALALVDEAWGRVAEDVLAAAGRDVTAAEIAKTMRVEEETAEDVLSSLAAHDRARIDIGHDAELRYSPGVDSPAGPPSTGASTAMEGMTPSLEDETASAPSDATTRGVR